MSGQANSSVQNEVHQLKIQGRGTVPSGSSLSRAQAAGSLLWDPRLGALFVSSGSAWSGVAAWERVDAAQETDINTAVTTTGTSGVITTQTASTGAGAVDSFTVNNANVTADSVVIVNLVDYSGTIVTNGIPYITVSDIAAGSFVVNVVNASATAAALDGTLEIAFFLL